MLSRLACLCALLALLACSSDNTGMEEDVSHHTLRGTVESGQTGLQGYEVSLIARYVGSAHEAKVLGHDTTDGSGNFRIDYRLEPPGPSGQQPVLFIHAARGPVLLISAIDPGAAERFAIVNERTTVATATAFAQFVHDRTIDGNTYGMQNAVHMAMNMTDPRTGDIADVLRLPPNGPRTTALRTFNSLSNMVAACVASEGGCKSLFSATTLPGGKPPATVPQAIANIAKYPWLHVRRLFAMSFSKQVYSPALANGETPDAWSIFLKFTGSFSSPQTANNLMNGPGNFAIDEKGFLWVNDNYEPEPPLTLACAGKRLLKFYPWGRKFPETPYRGGGLSGAGFGISIAPDGRIWVGNFGFVGTRATGSSAEDNPCPTPKSNSVSVFRPDGTPLSPDGLGFTSGAISWPQATVPDNRGTMWIANCGSDSVTVYPEGRRNDAFNVPIPNKIYGQMKPFAIAIDDQGNAWVTGNLSSTLAVISPDGRNVDVIGPVDKSHRAQIRRPMGVASDSKGNIWVANSDWVDGPCLGGKPQLGPGTKPSVALFLRGPNRSPDPDLPFRGGGLTVPWGIAVDGNDTVWVANFGFPFATGNPQGTAFWPAPNRVSNFCGVDTSKCPPTKQRVGAAISPDFTGYTSDALDRNTGVAIDPSGNVWLANNWKKVPIQGNPGGNSIVAMVGAAAPVQTPVIGPPQPFPQVQRSQ